MMADVRTRALARQERTANRDLLDRAIRHATFLERLKAGEVRRIISFLNLRVEPDIIDQIVRRLARIQERGFDRSELTTRRLKDLYQATDAIVAAGVRQIGETSIRSMVDVARAEAAWQVARLAEAVPIEWDFVMPSGQTLRSVVTSRPFQGRVLREWYSTLEDTTQRRLRDQVSIGIAQGESIDQMVRRVRGTRANRFRDGVMETTRREAESVVRSAVSHVSAHARETTFKENEDLVKGVQWVSTLSLVTCPRCAAIDGKVFPIDSGPRPPLHMSCRCSTSPALRSWKELGISLPEAPAGTRESMDGQVPDSVTFEDWLRGRSTAEQNEVLGVGKATLWRSGRVGLRDLTDSAFRREITLRELEAMDA